MRYSIKQDFFAWGDDYQILDEDEKLVYYVDGRGITITNKLSFQDMEKNELAFIQQTLLSWGGEYTISRGGKVFAKVSQKRLADNRCTFFVDVPGPNDLEASGDFYNRDYAFRRGPAAVARVSTAGLKEGFGVEINPGEDAPLILASAIVIELVVRIDPQKGPMFN